MPLVFVGNQIGAAGSTLTVDPTSGAIIVSPVAGQNLSLIAGNFILGAPASRIIPGATSLNFRNHADTVNTLSITDLGVVTIAPQSAFGTGAGSIQLGSALNTITVPDNTTSIQFVRINQTFAGTMNAPSGNSAHALLIDSHWADNTNGVGTLAGGYFEALHDGRGTDVQDLIGVIGRAYVTSTGRSSVGMWGVRGDVNITGSSGTLVNVAAVIGLQGSWSAAGTINTYAALQASSHNLSSGGVTVTDGYGALVAIPANAQGNNVGVQIGNRLSGAISSLALFANGGSWFKGTSGTPISDTTSSPATIALAAGNSGNPLSAIYFYRSASYLGYLGFDANASQVNAGHTKLVSDLVVGSDKLLVDTSGQIFSANSIRATTGLYNVPMARSSGNLPTQLSLSSAMHTGLNNIPAREVDFNFNVTQTFVGGGSPIATMDSVAIDQGIWAASAPQSIAKASSLRITNAPRPGPNMTLGATYALSVDDGISNFGGLIQSAASRPGSAGLNIPHGLAPTNSADGDIWTTSAGVFARISGNTKMLLSA